MKYQIGLLAGLFLTFAALTGCEPQSEPQAESEPALDWRAMPKIDVHTHYTYGRDYLVPLLEEWNIRPMIVEVAYDARRASWQPMVEHYQAYPDRFLLTSSFDVADIDEPGFADRVIAEIRRDHEAGAKMVKVWKNIGLVHKDKQGNFIQIDDPRFQPIWDYMAEAGIPVLAHIGEPKAAWTALDSTNPHYDYYANHPQYHFYNHPGTVPAWEEVIAARDRWLERNPNLVVVGAHLASVEHDTDELALRLDKFPNLYVDTSERLSDLAIQPTEKVRDFLIKYQDRVLYGTDLPTTTPATEMTPEQIEKERAELVLQRYQVHWDYFTRSDSVEFVRTGTPFRVMTKGLGLPADVLEKIYHVNAERVLKLEPATAPQPAAV